MFFDGYPQFYGTSRTAPGRERLNLRYEAIFAENKDLFEGARVLDIASHDGRWSLAALANGAKSVVGIEARESLVSHAADNLRTYGYDDDQFRFVVGDVHEVLRAEDFEVDVVLCLGFLYHTLRYNELFHGIRRTNAPNLIIDTQAVRMMGQRASIQVLGEKAAKQSAAAPDDYTVGNLVLTGRPNLAAMRIMLECYGYQVERLSDWKSLLRDNAEISADNCQDYADQSRITMRCVSEAAADS